MTGSAVAPATMTCWTGSSVSSAGGDDEALRLVLLLLQRRVGRDVLLEHLVGDVREDLLAVGADDRTGAVGRRASALFAAAFLAAVLRAGAFLAGASAAASGSAVFAAGAAFLAGAFLAVALTVVRALEAAAATFFGVLASSAETDDGYPFLAQYLSTALRCCGEVGGSRGGGAQCVGGDVSGRPALFDQGDDVWVGRTSAGTLRDVLGDTNYLSYNGWWARQGPFTSRAAFLL